jgi:hypothetical protein
LVDYAATKNVRLGVEGRRGYEEMPNEKELPTSSTNCGRRSPGYWHDFGHIQIKENLGFLNHEEWLRLIGPRAFGCHLQDVIWPGRIISRHSSAMSTSTSWSASRTRRACSFGR